MGSGGVMRVDGSLTLYSGTIRRNVSDSLVTLMNVSADIVIAPIAQVKSIRIFFMIIVVCVGKLIIVGVQSRKSGHYFSFSDK